jgi:hypothetical protein
MKITLCIAAALLTFLAGLAFRCWDHFAGVSGTRYVPKGHGWTGGPNVLQLTAFLWLLAGAVACLLLGLRDRLVLQLRQITGRQLSSERVMAWHLRNALGIDPHVPPRIGLAAGSKAS